MLKTRQIASHQGHHVRTSLIVICFDTHKELRWYRRMLLSLKTLFNLFASFLLYAIAIDREPDKEEGTSWGWRRSNHLYQLIYLYGANNCCVVCVWWSIFVFVSILFFDISPYGKVVYKQYTPPSHESRYKRYRADFNFALCFQMT